MYFLCSTVMCDLYESCHSLLASVYALVLVNLLKFRKKCDTTNSIHKNVFKSHKNK